MHRQSLKPVHILSLGACAICAQAIFIREMMALFTGTEFVIGALLAGWLFWVGLGGLLGGRLLESLGRRDIALFTRLTVSASILLPATTVTIRFTRGLIVSPPGVLPAFSIALLSALLVMGPFGFVYGMIYNIASHLWKRDGTGLPGGVSRVYIWEAAGSLVGALVFSFILLTFFSQLEVAFIVAFFVCAVVTANATRGKISYPRLVLIAFLGVVLIVFVPKVDRKSIESIFRGYRVERFLSSKYGEIVAVSKNEVLSFFSGGGRLFSVPEPERAEEVIHVPLLLHPEPRRLLLIGGSLGGGWEEAVKHTTVNSVDCLELDGELLELALKMERHHPPFLPERERPMDATTPEEQGVTFIEGDGRFFLSTGQHRYDVIILNAPPPVNLQWNRYYTKDFFELAERALSPGGIFALSHASSENYLSHHQARVLRCIETTMKEVFREVVILPGSTTHFLAGERSIDVDSLLPRIEERKIETRYVSENFIPFRFSEMRMEFLKSSLARARDVTVNTDTRPSMPLYELLLEGERGGSVKFGGMQRLMEIHPAIPFGALAAILLILFSMVRKGWAARMSVWAVGFGSFLLQLLILLVYQSYSGLLYYAIVLMTALFMGGASLGAWSSLQRAQAGERTLRWIHLCFIFLALLLLAWFQVLRYFELPHNLGAIGFLFFSTGGGFLTGFYYPIIVRTALPVNGSVVPATFYAWDLFGACIGGFLGGVLLFPLAGLAGAVVFLIFLHVSAATLLVGRW